MDFQEYLGLRATGMLYSVMSFFFTTLAILFVPLSIILLLNGSDIWMVVTSLVVALVSVPGTIYYNLRREHHKKYGRKNISQNVGQTSSSIQPNQGYSHTTHAKPQQQFVQVHRQVMKKCRICASENPARSTTCKLCASKL